MGEPRPRIRMLDLAVLEVVATFRVNRQNEAFPGVLGGRVKDPAFGYKFRNLGFDLEAVAGHARILELANTREVVH